MRRALTASELRRLRLAAQGLPADARGEGSGAERAAATARRMLALQGQDWRSSRWALGVRTPGIEVEHVHAAFDAGTLVRSWPMRGTVHVVAAEDIGWLQTATNHRVLKDAPRRREFLGLDDAVLEQLVEVSVAALRGGAALDRDELAATWTEAGIEWKSNWRYHLVWWLCQNGLAVFGPVSGGDEPRLVSAEEWITAPRRLGGDEALAELAVRYASPRGAVSVKDLAWWSGMTVGESRRAVSLASDAGRLVPIPVEDAGELWAAPGALDRIPGPSGAGTGAGSGAEAADWLLLPAFDEHLLGYQDRSAQLEPGHFARIVPGRNGVFLATVVRDGRVVGTWKRGAKQGEGIVATALPGESLDAGVERLAERAAEWGAFQGLDRIAFAVTAP
ncbi:AlkZ family DNA glycosylase [Leucobacter weissii]|uniref:AlkZ family DNA glycosylase n=1 Tax=Leucobacter weissii TaxID=1983706 RepID=A0A939MH83_9MICO|nr:winged helix DNA-binding domain-containing protein [Leucobacter weissii]MBO1900873.1 AlkZ family DNA glycosylase [Leucobacter weissii]